MTEKAKMLSEALAQAQRAVTLLGQNEEALRTLGEIYVAGDNNPQGYEAFRRAAAAGNGGTFDTLESLCLTALDLRRRDEALQWFSQLIGKEDAPSISYWFFADALRDRREYAMAGRAYDRAAQSAGKAGGSGTLFWCEAARSWWAATEADEALGSARACVEGGRGNLQLKKDVANAYRIMADIFLARGLKEEALIQARQALDVL